MIQPLRHLLRNSSQEQPDPRAHWVLRIGGVYLMVAALLLLGRLISPEFWAPENLLQVLKDVSILGIVAVGLSFITLSGHFVDLSIPAIMACSGIVSVYTLSLGFVPALLSGIAVGGMLGLVNGFMVGCLRLNPILWTLAAMSVFDGVTRWAYGGKWVYATPESPAGAAFAQLYRGKILGVLPITVLLFLAAAALAHLLMRHTAFGQRLTLTGAAREVAEMSGVNVHHTVLLAFVISGITAALAGLVKTSFNMFGDVEIGVTYDFQAITAVVLGGVTLAGGRGSIPGVIGGVLVIGLLGQILPLIPGVGQNEQFVIRGFIFIAIVGVNAAGLRKSGRDDA